MNWLVELIKSNGRISVFLGGLLEEIIIPIPSPLVSMTGGAFLVTQKEFWPAFVELFFKVSLPFAIGATIGSTVAYLTAFYGGKFFIQKFQRFTGFGWGAVEKTREKYIKGSGDELAIVILRAIPVIPVSLVSAVCGTVRLDWKEFYIFTFFGLILRSTILGLIGWQAEQTYKKWMEGLNTAEDIVLALILVITVAVFGFLYLKREKFIKKADIDSGSTSKASHLDGQASPE